MSRLRDKWTVLSLEDKAEVLRIMTKEIILGRDGKNTMEITWEDPWGILINQSPIESGWHTLIDNFKTLRFTIMKWSVKERIEHLRYTLSN